MKPLFYVLLSALFISAFILISCGGGDDDDDSDDDNDASGQCNISDENMVEVPGEMQSTDCGEIGLTVLVDKILANTTMTIYQVQGQYSVENDNTYFIRGKGDVTDKLCFDEIYNSGTFSVLIEFMECTTAFQLDVVTSYDEEATSFCTITVSTDLTCDEDDDIDDDIDDDDDSGDDDDDDDDSSFDDAVNSCVEAYVSCGVDEATAELSCSFMDSYQAYWNDCFGTAIENYFNCLEESECIDAVDCANTFSTEASDCY
jgi:hypothetical protein